MKTASVVSCFISSAHSSASWRNLSESGCVTPVLHQALSWPPQGTETAANQAARAWTRKVSGSPTMLMSVHPIHISCHCQTAKARTSFHPSRADGPSFPYSKEPGCPRIQKEFRKCITTKMRNVFPMIP